MLGKLLVALLFAHAPLLAQELPAVRAQVESGKVVLVDVREQDEWEERRLAAARLVPFSSVTADPAKAAGALPKDKPVYLHCAAGGRARKAATLLKKEGVDARALDVKYQELVKAGFPEAR